MRDKLRVLIVDDNHDAADSLARLLKVLGHEVRVAYRGTDALVEAQDFQPEIAFIDIVMPGISGYEVAQSLRDSSAVRVAVTGWPLVDFAKSDDFDYVLRKPADLEALNGLLDSISAARCGTVCV